MLNRIIDKTVPPERPVINAVGKAGRALTELVHELKTFEEPSSDIPYLRGLARALAEFRTDELLIDHTQHMSNIESPYDHITDAEGDEDDTVDAGSVRDWLVFGAAPVLIKRTPARLRPVWVALPLLGAIAAYLAINKPFA